MNNISFMYLENNVNFSLSHVLIILNTITFFQEADLAPALRALNDAVTRTFPMARYTPVTRKEKIQAFVAEHLPRSVYDIIYS